MSSSGSGSSGNNSSGSGSGVYQLSNGNVNGHNGSGGGGGSNGGNGSGGGGGGGGINNMYRNANSNSNSKIGVTGAYYPNAMQEYLMELQVQQHESFQNQHHLYHNTNYEINPRHQSLNNSNHGNNGNNGNNNGYGRNTPTQRYPHSPHSHTQQHTQQHSQHTHTQQHTGHGHGGVSVSNVDVMNGGAATSYHPAEMYTPQKLNSGSYSLGFG